MKKTAIAVLMASLIGTGALSALDISGEIQTGNLGFDKDATSPDSATGKTYDALLGFGGDFSVSENLTDRLSFSAGFDRDDILRNSVFTLVGFDAGYVTMTVGPFFGPFNVEDSVLTSGISTKLSVNFPGIIYGSFRSDSTIGAGLAAPGDYVQEMSAIEVGFWVPNVIVSGKLTKKSFSYMDSASLSIIDDLTRYDFNTHVFKKNVPYTVEVNIAYQVLERSYVGDTDTARDELDSVLVGTKIAVTTSPTLSFYLGGEFALYSWGVSGLGSPSTDTALFTAFVGGTWKIPRDGIKEKTGFFGPAVLPEVKEAGAPAAGPAAALPGEEPGGSASAPGAHAATETPATP